MAIPLRELRGHKYLKSCAPVNSYDFPRATHPTSQHPHGRGTAASYRTTDNHTNGPTYPEANPGHTDSGTCCPDAQTTAGRPPYAGTPQSTGPRAAAPRPSQHRARVGLIYPLTHCPTPSRCDRHSPKSHRDHNAHALPSPEDLNASNLTPPG